MSEVGEIPAGYGWSAVGSQAFKASMSAFPTGVTIVTTLDENGSACGLTCNAFMSVSVDPPLVVISVDKSSQTLPALRRARHFVVNFLAAGREGARDALREQAHRQVQRHRLDADETSRLADPA